MGTASTIGLAMALVVLTGIAGADEPDRASQANAARLAVGVCGTCHGPRGVSRSPSVPRLAGQSAGYLSAQLRAFREHVRRDPDAISYMWGMASNLDDRTIDALAQYYAAQSAGPARPGDPALAARGKEIYEKGAEPAGTPSCATCHGFDGHGMADFPRLAGQHSEYLLTQLRSFQNNARAAEAMRLVAKDLSERDFAAIAAFLQSRP